MILNNPNDITTFSDEGSIPADRGAPSPSRTLGIRSDVGSLLEG